MAEEFDLSMFVELCDGGNIVSASSYAKKCEQGPIPLPWPKDCSLILKSSGLDAPVKFNEADLKVCETQFLGIDTNMTLIGWAGSEGRYCPLIRADTGLLYAYDFQTDCLYEVAGNVAELVSIGMIRYDPFHMGHRDTGVNHSVNRHRAGMERIRYLRSRQDFEELLKLRDVCGVAGYVKQNCGKNLALTWPENHKLIIMDQNAAGVTNAHMMKLRGKLAVPEPLTFLGLVRSKGLGTLFGGLMVLLGDSGKVYASVVDSVLMLDVADSMRTFVRVGFCRLVEEYRLERVGVVSGSVADLRADEASTEVTVLDNSRLPLKKRKIVMQPFAELSSIYGPNGVPKFDFRWWSLRDTSPGNGKRYEMRDRSKLQRFLENNAGAWLPLVWPPKYGLAMGTASHFLLASNMAQYRQFTCTDRSGMLYFIGMICEYGTAPDTSSDMEVLMTDSGRVLGYMPAEHRMYDLATSIDEFSRIGAILVYSFFERDFDDPQTESMWYNISPSALREMLECSRDRRRMLRFSCDHSGMIMNSGGPVQCEIEFGTVDTVGNKKEVKEIIRNIEVAGYFLFGRVIGINAPLFLDDGCRVYALVSGARVVKLAESVRGFFRHGCVWFARKRRYCFCPRASTVITVSGQLNIPVAQRKKCAELGKELGRNSVE
uniref:GP29 n=1 Tax=Caviid herpesvirus 2 str. CIDMTR TaxID=1415526 RepID=U6H9S9_9BETA|nr:GP29 [Caviid herpesvirus 2 str. CIDMTR]